MAEFDDKVNGNTVDASEYNAIVREIRNAILDSDQALAADDHQVAKAMANYAAVSTFYTDSGAANAYVVAPQTSFNSPTAYKNGMLVRFRPANANTLASTVNVNSLGVKSIKKADGSTDVAAGDIVTSEDLEVRYDGTNFRLTGSSGLVSSSVVNIVNTQVTSTATGTTVIPFDDTIPQNTEGDEYMSLSITPTSATNTLYIDVVFVCSLSSAQDFTIALFQDSITNAIAALPENVNGASVTRTTAFRYKMTAGTTSPTTFKVRAGGVTGTLRFNGSFGARLYGGVCTSSITITEIEV